MRNKAPLKTHTHTLDSDPFVLQNTAVKRTKLWEVKNFTRKQTQITFMESRSTECLQMGVMGEDYKENKKTLSYTNSHI